METRQGCSYINITVAVSRPRHTDTELLHYKSPMSRSIVPSASSSTFFAAKAARTFALVLISSNFSDDKTRFSKMDARLQSGVRRLKRNRGTTEDMHAPLRFLRNVIFGTTDHDLLHHPEVVGGDGADLRSKNGRFLVDSITRSTGGTEEFAGQGVELGMTAGLRESFSALEK
jgi:hypothetical protein